MEENTAATNDPDQNNRQPVNEVEITSTFMPNFDEQHVSQYQQITDFVVNMGERGAMDTDVYWTRGFFLETFPYIFICNND